MFQGFSQGAVDFLWGIRFNNERSWFLAHKQEFLDFVDTPMKELGRQLYEAMADEYPELGLNLHVCRVYRDARRLYGRGPYKDHLWLVLEHPHDRGEAVPAFYFEIAPEYYSSGMGYWDAPAGVMARLRARIDRDPAPMEKLARRLKGTQFELGGQEYKRPKGDPGPLLYPWYNRKNIAIGHDENCEGVLFTPQLFDQVLADLKFLVPYYQYFCTLPSDPEPRKQ